MSSRARLFRWIAAAAAVLIAVVVGVVTYQTFQAQQIAETQRMRAEQTAKDQRQRAEQTLTAAVGNANGLTVELARLFESEVKAPPARVKDILDRTRVLQQQLTASGLLTPELSRGEAAALRSTVDLLLKINDTAGALSSA